MSALEPKVMTSPADIKGRYNARGWYSCVVNPVVLTLVPAMIVHGWLQHPISTSPILLRDVLTFVAIMFLLVWMLTLDSTKTEVKRGVVYIGSALVTHRVRAERVTHIKLEYWFHSGLLLCLEATEDDRTYLVKLSNFVDVVRADNPDVEVSPAVWPFIGEQRE